MLSKFMKNMLVFSVVTAIVWGFFLSCENPFSNNLGAKVDVEPPTITVGAPTVGAYIKDTARFSGSATAYREIRSIEVQIFDPNDIDPENPLPPLLPWTVIVDGNKTKTQDWEFNLDTLNFFGPEEGLDDGFLKIQFRTKDPNLTTATAELIFIIKNKPSVVKLTAPDVARVDATNPTPKLGNDSEIRGQIIDRRGIKPGYPRIKLWPYDLPEPAGDDLDWGWVQLFISGEDGTPNDSGRWTYTDRTQRPVVRAANFILKLAQYTIDPVTRQAVYDLSGGDYKPLDTGRYNFRIVTSDTFFYDDVNANPEIYLLPRDPQEGEVEAIGWYPGSPVRESPLIDPDEYPNPLESGPCFDVQLISSGVRPTVELDNSDKTEAELEAIPNIYINSPTAKKITTVERNTEKREDFRLQILAAHPDYIKKAVLQYEHTGAILRTGFLTWDNPEGSDGYVNNTDIKSRAEEGHKGKWKDPNSHGEGKFFTFTAYNDLKDEEGNFIFTTSTEPYSLIVTVWSESDIATPPIKYSLYLDGAGPAVNIRSVRGAYSDPVASGLTEGGGMINDNNYVVNGNIQVSIDRSANQGIRQSDRQSAQNTANILPMVKWIIEEDKPGYLTADDTVLSKLKEYRGNPLADSRDFFDDIDNSAASGWVELPNSAGQFPEDRTNNFKIKLRSEDPNAPGINQWNLKYLWLYIIAEDGVHNLGYVVQKLYVDDDKDKPEITIPQLDAAFTTPESLLVQVDGDGHIIIGQGNDSKQNILDRDQGISLTFTDDDGISKAAGITITLTHINTGEEKTLSLEEMDFLSGRSLEGLAGTSKEWSGMLSQEHMAQVLYGTSSLPGGIYQLQITVEDDVAAKVSIGEDVPPSAGNSAGYYFAVQSMEPLIKITTPGENTMQNKDPTPIVWTIKSWTALQQLSISFNPHLGITAGESPDAEKSEIFKTSDANIDDYLEMTEDRDADGSYIYTWNMKNDVNFDPRNGDGWSLLFPEAGDPNPPDYQGAKFDWRRFNIEAYDSLGVRGVVAGSVQVDTTPPTLEMIEFNFGRTYNDVNGKVPFIISAYDLNGIGSEIRADDEEWMMIKWWVQTTLAADPGWDTAFPTGAAGAGGQFRASERLDDGNYRTVFDTRPLAEGTSYTLWAMAEDAAGNLSKAERLYAFEVNQDGDIPTLDEEAMQPDAGKPQMADNLMISGEVSDDDGFDRNKVNDTSTYVQIRFAASQNSAGTEVYTWGPWTPVPTQWIGSAETISYSLNLDALGATTAGSTLFGGYFTQDGQKIYQIKVTDEPVPGNGNPGKNPEEPKAPLIGTRIGAASRIFPLDDETFTGDAAECAYTFLLKNSSPQVYFKQYDPDSEHPNYSSTRPVYSTVEALITDFTRGYVEEGYFDEATFTYGGMPGAGIASIGPHKIESIAADSFYKDRHYWDLDNTAATGSLNWFANFAALPDGMHSIFIQPFDLAGNGEPFEWSFYKDTEGPEINFTNISEIYSDSIIGNLSYLSGGDPNEELFLKGSFRDDYAPIAATFRYSIDGGTVESKGITSAQGNSASWEIPIAVGLADGVHRVRIWAFDNHGNESFTADSAAPLTVADVYFIVDRNIPRMSEPQVMFVSGALNDETGAFPAAGKPLPDLERRVFSAATTTNPYPGGPDTPETQTTAVFTLRGLIYEKHLTELTASVTNVGSDNTLLIQRKLEGIDAWATGYTHGDGSLTTGNFKLGAAAAADITALNRPTDPVLPAGVTGPNDVWVWEFTICQGDFYLLKNETPGVYTSDSQWRLITLAAQDGADHSSGRKTWRFRLDSQSPKIEFLTEDGALFEGDTVTPMGIVTDDTNVKEIKYRIGKWDYALGSWHYYNNTTGSWAYNNGTNDIDNATHEGHAVWRNMLGVSYTPRSSVNWSLNSAVLAASAYYPETLFETEGKYKLDLYVTDYSLSSVLASAGNPYNTIPLPEPVTPPDVQKPVTTLEFFVDRAEPAVNITTPELNFYRSTGGLTFTFTASDANTIYGDPTAVLTQFGTTSPELGGGKFTATGTEPNYTVTIPSAAFSLGAGARYTLTLSVTDGAGKPATNGITRDFYVDNTPPTVTISPNAGIITGRVQFQGKFDKPGNLSPVTRVAYYIPTAAEAALGTNPKLSPDETYPGGIDKWLDDNSWHFYYDGFNGPNTNPYRLMSDAAPPQILAEIQDGLANANIIIPNTRFFEGGTTTYKRNVRTIANVITENSEGDYIFAGHAVPGTDEVYDLTVYFIALDEAGNVSAITPRTYVVYPEGDRPIVDVVSSPNAGQPEVQRLMNGRIRISGSAIDNVRVKYVWFRVLNGETNVPFTNLRIPKWDSLWNEATGTEAGLQDPQTFPGTSGAGSGSTATGNGGWYMANGGDSIKVSWWAYINTDGELDPPGAGSQKIILEVMAQDTYWDDYLPDPDVPGSTGAYETDRPYTGKSYLSKIKPVTAYVVNGAPSFDNEMVRMGHSDGTGADAGTNPIDFTSNWESIASANIKGMAAYAITVKHDTGVGSIRWTRPDGSTVDLLASNDYTNTTYKQHYDAIVAGTAYNATTSPGIAARAMPKALTQTMEPNTTYMIWTPATTFPAIPLAVGGTLHESENVRHTIFTTGNGTPTVPTTFTGGQLMPQAADGAFEWVVVIDVNSDVLEGGIYAGQAKAHTLEFSATEISKAVPLTSNKTALLPIDNKPPRAQYTQTINVAGSAATFGGEAGDLFPGDDVGGLSRVVVWFSRLKDGAETSISWAEKAVEGGDGAHVFAPNTTVGWRTLGEAFGITGTTAGVQIPADYLSGVTSGNWSSVVIDRNDQLGYASHHGHKLNMGFQTIGGELGTAWYVALDSTRITSGRVTVHYIVYDKAGNYVYGSQKLMVLNNIPRIDRIQLATDNRGDINNNAGFSLATGASSSSGTNYTYETGRPGITGALERIRTALTTAGSRAYAYTTNLYGSAAAVPDSVLGISDWVNMDTTTLGMYSVVYDAPFNVRNNLLAMRVEILNDIDSTLSRSFRLEHVSHVRDISGSVNLVNAANGIKAGRVYIINNPGITNPAAGQVRFPWGALGAQGKDEDGDRIIDYKKGIAFLALEDGNGITLEPGDYGNPSVWELNGTYYDGSVGSTNFRTIPTPLTLADAQYAAGGAGAAYGKNAEFVYSGTAFGAVQDSIKDFTPVLDANNEPEPYTKTPERTGTDLAGWNPLGHSLFIVRVFDNNEAELFGDFALLSIRVNNNDKTPPFAQLYDMNPLTEGSGQPQNIPRSAAPRSIGGNRTMGGLYNTTAANADKSIEKSGHIEPRRITQYTGYNHSLTSQQMGGARDAVSQTVESPWADPASFLAADTVSGRVILRGYAEDDQRIGGVSLQIGGTNINILESAATNAAVALAGDVPAITGLLQVPAAQIGNVFYTDTIDLNRHRVEWAYIWNTETMPNGTVVGTNITVQVQAATRTTTLNSPIAAAPGTPHTAASVNNAGFPTGLYKYNQIGVNLRPYITGFAREKTTAGTSYHDERSLQGRVMFSRGERYIVKGFNLGRTANNTTNVYIPGVTGAANFATAAATAANLTTYGITGTANDAHYRIINNAIPAAARSGTVTLEVVVTGAPAGTFAAVNNTISYIQPWNVEYDPAIEGSELWDDHTAVHIWQSDNTSNNNDNNTDNGYFRTSGNDGWTVINPAISIDKTSGRLFESHNEGGSGSNANSGTLRTSNNYQTGLQPTYPLIDFIDPVIYSDIYRSPGGGGNGGIAADTWIVSSVIGRYGNNEEWRALGGIWIRGPNGANMPFGVMTAANANSNVSMYNGESTWYNASSRSNTTAVPPTTDQFSNPHIVTSYSGTGNTTREHIHVSYYDTKDGSIKYRYNLRTTATGNNASRAGTIDTGIATGGNANNDTNAARNIPKMWTNLDGGVDQDDLDQTTYTHADVGTGNINANTRVVRYNASIAGTQTARGNINAGEHNAIAVTAEGYPVVAYFDQTNQRLKLAVSRSTSPVLATQWAIRDKVIPDGNDSQDGTGEYVSMKIDTFGTAATNPNYNRVHIAAMNSMNNSLVYITGIINPTGGTANAQHDSGGVLTGVEVMVVDSVGSVGRWAALSLDSQGYPWIAYHDDSYIGSMDAAKMAYFNPAFTKKLPDINGGDITGWETMHVPARWRVENPIFAAWGSGRVGLECWPPRLNPTANAHSRWSAAVSYMSSSGLNTPNNRYRIAYYVKEQ